MVGLGSLFSSDMAIDLGTANTLVHLGGRGIILREPSVVAINKDTNELLAVGEEAKRMLGRTPANIVATRPLRDGVIADYDSTEYMLKAFIRRAARRAPSMFVTVVVGIPSGVTEVERLAVIEAAKKSGAYRAFVIEEPMAAAIGAGMPIEEPMGNMVVDIGGDTSDITVISLGNIVIAESLRVGGDKFDEAISRYVRRNYNLAIGEQTSEDMKIRIGNCYPRGEVMTLNIRGRDLVLGLPREIQITSTGVAEAISEQVQSIVDGIRRVLELTPPELSADIIEGGVVLTGGGALLRNLPELVTEQTGISCHVADQPMECVALGTGKAMEELDKLKDSGTILSTSRKGGRRSH